MWDSITTTTGKRDTRGNYSDKPPYTDPYVRWCERRTVSPWLTAAYSIANAVMASLLPNVPYLVPKIYPLNLAPER